MKFTFIKEDEYNNSKITYEFNAENLDAVVCEFEMFLKGAGYNYDGSLDFISDEERFGTDKDLEEEIIFSDLNVESGFNSFQLDMNDNEVKSVTWPFPTTRPNEFSATFDLE